MSYTIKNLQSKTTVIEDLPTLSLVAARLKDLKPSCWKGYHPFTVVTDGGFGSQPLSVEDEERLADLTGLRVAVTGQKSPHEVQS